MYGKNFLEQRKLKGWTQEKIAKKLGVTTQSYSYFENNKRNPSVDILVKLGSIFGVSISKLVGEVDDSPQDKQIEENTQNPHSCILLNIVKSISINENNKLVWCIESQEPIPLKWVNDSDCFYFRSKDNSMSQLRILENDLLLFQKKTQVKNGDINLILHKNELLVRKLTKIKDIILVEPANPMFSPIVLPLKSTDIRVIGTLARIIID